MIFFPLSRYEANLAPFSCMNRSQEFFPSVVNGLPNGEPGMGMQRRGKPTEVCMCPKCKKNIQKHAKFPAGARIAWNAVFP